MKIRFFAILALFSISHFIWGQSNKEAETYLMGFKIISIEKKGNGVYRVTIPHGIEIGLKAGDNANAYGILRKEVAKHNHQIGKAIWTDVALNKSSADLTLNDKDTVYEGDLLYVNIGTPKRVRTSYFFLLTEAISIVKDDGEPYYSFKDIFENDGYAMRHKLFLAMQKDIQAAGEKLKLSGDSSIIQEGPNAGKLVCDVMIKTDTMSIWYYVYHIGQMSWDTMGQSIKLSDNFKLYAEEGDAVSSALLKTLFIDASSDDREVRFPQYKRKITRELLEDWKESGYKLKNEERYADAIKLFEAAAYLAHKIGETYNEGVYYFSIGEVYDKQGLYDSSIRVYQKTIPVFATASSDFAIGYAHQNIGKAYKELNNYQEAEVHLKKAFEIRSKVAGENPTNVDYAFNLYYTLEALASVEYELKNFKASVDFYKSALQVAPGTKDRKTEGDAFWNVAYACENGIFDHEEGYVNYKKAIEIFLELKDTANAIILSRSLGIVSVNAKNFTRAKADINYAIQLARNWKSDIYLPYILHYQGTLFFDNGEYENSYKSFIEAEAIYKRTGNVEKLMDVKKSFVKSLRDGKRYSEALAKQKERIPLLKKGDVLTEGDFEWDMAFIYGKLKNGKNEVLHYEKSEKLYAELKDSANVSILINNIGYAYRDMLDSVNSYKQLNRAVSYNMSRKNNIAIGDSYEHLATVYKKFKNFRKSFTNYKLAEHYYHLASNKLKVANMADEQAQLLWDLKKFPEAITRAKESIEMYHDVPDSKEEASSYWDYGYQLSQSMNNFDEAIVCYDKAYALYMQVKDSVDASTMLSNIGQDYWSKLNYEKAIEYHAAAIALAEKCRNDKQVASSWSKLSELYKKTNNPVAAVNALNNAAESLKKVNDSTLLGTTYQDLANAYVKSKEYPKAIDLFTKSIAIQRIVKDTLSLATTLYDFAFVYQSKNDSKSSDRLYQESLSLRKKINDREGEMYSLVGLANLELLVNNNYKKSEIYFLESERIANAVKSEYLLAFIYSQMKWLYRAQGKALLAETSVKKSLELYKKLKNAREIANILVSMSYDASNVSGDQLRSLKLLDEAQVIADTLKDLGVQAYIYDQRASSLREIGEFQQALTYVDKSLALYKEVDSNWGVAGVFITKGNVYKQLSEYDLAIKNEMLADSLFKLENTEYARLAPLANIGENYSAQGDYAKAMGYYQQSLAIITKAGDKNENLAILQALMGEANFYQGNYPEAEKWLKQSLLTCDQIDAMRPKPDNLSIMGRLKLEEKKYAEARIFLNEGMKIAKEKSMRISYLNNLVLLGRLEVETKNYAAATPYLEETIKASKEMNKNATLWEGLYWMGVMYRDLKDLPKASEYLKEAVAVIEKIRNKVSGGEEARKLFSSDKNISKVSEVLVDILLQIGETELAMSYLQKSNEDNLKAKYRGLDIKFQDEGKNQVIGQERTMKAKLDGIEQQLSNEKALPLEKQNTIKIKNLEGIQTIAEGDYLKFVNQQVNVQPELSKFFSNSVQPSEFRKRKKQIPKDMALLSYLPGEKQLYIFMATNDTVIAKVINISREQLAKDVNSVMSIVRIQQGSFGKLELGKEEQERKELVSTVKQTDKMMIPFEELYHYLISPVAAEIAGKKKLCIIPNGPLSYIPFQLLGKTLQNGKFSLLANQFSIFYTNSTDMLLRTLEGGEKDYNILAFGNPDKSLPSTEKEVTDIKKLFPNASIYTRDDATEDKAKFADVKFNVMHFATHGNLDYEDFSKSYLTMASNPSKHEDGRLTLEELWGMEVMNHLNIVVLSACQTAVTKGSNESSPVSPASGFLQNGVKSVVATLWKVDDEATALLIGDFYKNIKTMDAVDALRISQINLSHNPKFASPYFWAGAILMGDWR